MHAPFFIGFEIGLQKVRKEKNFQDDKKNKEFHKDDQPNLLPPGTQVSESVIIEFQDINQEPHKFTGE